MGFVSHEDPINNLFNGYPQFDLHCYPMLLTFKNRAALW